MTTFKPVKTRFLDRPKVRLARRCWMLYLMLLPPVAYAVIFYYIPMYGVQIAFKTFRANLGIWGSKWNDFYHFKTLFSGYSFYRILWNTIRLSLLSLLFGFPAPIIFAVLLNELKNLRFKKLVQTISYLPHFMSWVVLGLMVKQFLSPQYGALNAVRQLLGLSSVYYITIPSLFTPILIISNIWATVGWSSIIYIASMSAIDPQLYEAAEIDGANRFNRALHVTLPGIRPVVSIQLILSMGGILGSNFDQIMNLTNARVAEVSNVLSMYVYNMGIVEARYDFSTAVGLFTTVVGLILILVTNFASKRLTESGIW